MKRPDRGDIIRLYDGVKPSYEIRDIIIMELEKYIDYIEEKIVEEEIFDIEYYKSTEAIKKAYFNYKKQENTEVSARSFTAGYNSALNAATSCCGH